MVAAQPDPPSTAGRDECMTSCGTPWLGILMLDTRFPRVAGDAGRVDSWRMPARLRVVQGASPQRVVHDADPALLAPFLDAARRLVDEGAAALTTSCGFLVHFQQALQAAVPVPVWSSSLLAVPALPRPGVITVAGDALGALHLQAAGAPLDTPVEGLAPGCRLQVSLLQNLPTLDVAAAQADVVAAAQRLCRRHPDVTSLVLECTNMPPYAAAVTQATGLPVVDLLSFVHERWTARGLPLAPRNATSATAGGDRHTAS
jgi:hypothetical protein